MPESLELLDYVSRSELYAIQGSGYDGLLFTRTISKYGRYVSLPHLFGVAIVGASREG